MKNRINLVLLLALAALFTGCASTTPQGILVTAQRDPAFSPTRTDRICLTQQLNSRPEDAALARALTAELTRENFNIVTNTDADYTLACVIEDDSTSVSVPRAIHPYSNAPTSTVTPNVPGIDPLSPEERENGGQPGLQTEIVQVEYVHPDQGIRLYLYANPKKHPGLQIAWQGCIEAGQTVSPGREPLLIKTLLGYFGQDYTGRVALGQ